MRLGDILRDQTVREHVTAIHVTTSFGVAFAQRGDAWGALFARADRALYEANAAGRDRVQVAAGSL